ncbi:SCP2 sterol-binding domain-containing protein [Microcoleus sp. D2B6]|uniref:SCP2 sterol-binding domain-containing protein n=1 Tax=unclassified Microcoleus TaxID=2642155 RepID=UPI002FD18C57
MTVNVEKLFNELLPAAMLKNPKYFKEIGLKATFRITGEGGGEWCVNASDSGQSVTQGNLGDSDSTITMSAEDFQQHYQDSNALLALYFSGRLTVSSNHYPEIIGKVPKIFNLGN